MVLTMIRKYGSMFHGKSCRVDRGDNPCFSRLVCADWRTPKEDYVKTFRFSYMSWGKMAPRDTTYRNALPFYLEFVISKVFLDFQLCICCVKKHKIVDDLVTAIEWLMNVITMLTMLHCILNSSREGKRTVMEQTRSSEIASNITKIFVTRFLIVLRTLLVEDSRL